MKKKELPTTADFISNFIGRKPKKEFFEYLIILKGPNGYQIMHEDCCKIDSSDELKKLESYMQLSCSKLIFMNEKEFKCQT
jgi:hypothetical protein